MLPSRVESIPVIFSDAAQLGRPLVATPVGDLPRLFAQHEFGILADDAEAEAFAGALRRALDTPPLKFKPKLAAVAEEFDMAVIAARFAGQLGGLQS
jgi:glycosyltransferase involved in cell wall biosynthesis